MEQGKVDLAINRFNEIPQSFHQVLVWRDSFSCILNDKHPAVTHLNLKSYLDAQHIWVSKTGMGVGFGVNPDKQAGLGWIDQALERIGQRRKISVFTRHYQMPALLAQNVDLIATLPTRMARLQTQNPKLVIKDPPFYIPEFELKMAWCPLLHHHPAHHKCVCRILWKERLNPCNSPEFPVPSRLYQEILDPKFHLSPPPVMSWRFPQRQALAFFFSLSKSNISFAYC